MLRRCTGQATAFAFAKAKGLSLRSSREAELPQLQWFSRHYIRKAHRCIDTNRGSELCCMAIAKLEGNKQTTGAQHSPGQERSGTVSCLALCRVLDMSDGQ